MTDDADLLRKENTGLKAALALERERHSIALQRVQLLERAQQTAMQLAAWGGGRRREHDEKKAGE